MYKYASNVLCTICPVLCVTVSLCFVKPFHNFTLMTWAVTCSHFCEIAGFPWNSVKFTKVVFFLIIQCNFYMYFRRILLLKWMVHALITLCWSQSTDVHTDCVCEWYAVLWWSVGLCSASDWQLNVATFIAIMTLFSIFYLDSALVVLLLHIFQ